MATPVTPPGLPAQIVAISTDSLGTFGNGNSADPALSNGGRLLVFASTASNLLSGVGNGKSQVYVKNLATSVVSLVSADANGTLGNGDSATPVISPDGRTVSFASTATNLVPGGTSGSQIFVKNLQSGAVMLVSANSSGVAGNGSSLAPRLSFDGHSVAFASAATNLVDDAGNPLSHIYIKDLRHRSVARLSASSSGALGNGNNVKPVLSAGGRYVAFVSAATNLVTGDSNGKQDVVVRDWHGGGLSLASTSASGSQADQDCDDPAIAADGQLIAFSSAATTLIPGVGNGKTQIFVKNRQTGALMLASADGAGTAGNDNSSKPVLSADGRFVVFISAATNLITGSAVKGQVLVKDLQTKAIARVSMNNNGSAEGNAASSMPTISSDGLYVSFVSAATNLVAGTANGNNQVFLAPNPLFPHEFQDCTDCPVLVELPAGRFIMGSDDGGSLDFDISNTVPVHQVEFASSLGVGKYVVTFAQFDACVQDPDCKNGQNVRVSSPNDQGWGRGSLPVINVSWNDAQTYVGWLSRKTGKTYRLLSEAEWEYAARGGTTTQFWWGDDPSHDYANYGVGTYGYECCGPLTEGKDLWLNTSPVGQFAANPFGLYDMAGNVWEWIQDCSNPDYTDAPADGSAWQTGTCVYRGLRGAGWDGAAEWTRPANRHFDVPSLLSITVGFRVARVMP